jgi:hypothetical protein
LKDRPQRPSLPSVSLVAVTSVALHATIDALHASMRQVEFGRVLLLSDLRPPAHADSAIHWREIEPLRSRSDYSRFMLRELATYIETGHALCVQWDGYVLRGSAWNANFLDFDYIGAAWPHFRDGHNVGNGGFSLRSRRLLEACRNLPFDGSEAEDVIIGRTCRQQLEEQDCIRFAPEHIARAFSYERTAPRGNEFGFHGAYNLVRLVGSTISANLFRTLEPGMLARSERIEIMRWAIARGAFRLAAQLLFRLL